MVDIYKEVSELRPGNFLKEDIYANTKNPIIAKDTKLTLEHFDVLRSFGIARVLIESKAQGHLEQPEEKVTEVKLTPEVEKLMNQSAPAKSTTLESLYDDTVEAYRKEFASYKSGKKLDVAVVRTIALPVIQAFLENKEYVRRLNEFSTIQNYQAHHSISVGILAALISDQMGYPKGQVLQIGIAGVLADSGMAKINQNIIDKVAFLTSDEINEVKKHVIHSFQMVSESPLVRQEMKVAILQHHERFDGSGYPRGLKGQEITEISQILSVADVYHAMASERPYRQKESSFKVIELMREEEFGKFDMKIIQVLHDLINKLSIGTRVKLSTDEIAEIIYLHRDFPLRPIVKVLGSGQHIDLSANRKISIVKNF
ncbi:HD-GYP domain-containing protein [Sporosarcina sp. PTS2304]|uniref:HD-GYP domain-containing protein n=1 Tax=Sporosarcina sp. PTS2304 TaxID=2283194 RepID=UPI000E0CEB2E|nr:HD-GYP domain-containing protein [Sporosarcina sp. PTS2304]AXI00684.1 HD-GYP domain-containing protein [Sporosarcina sp. PTS2304]